MTYRPLSSHIITIVQNSIEAFIALFIGYSFLGWVIETTFKTIVERRGFVNSGLLYGPVVPIYGLGAFLIALVDDATRGLSVLPRVLVLTLLCAALEYLVSFIFEVVFKTRLWDYSHRKLNVRGRVCLSFTLAWAALAVLFIYAIRPAAERALSGFLTLPWSALAIYAAFAALLFDAAVSMGGLVDASSFLAKISDRLEPFELAALRASARRTTRRLMSAFPHLGRTMAGSIGLDILRRSAEEGGGPFLNALQAIRARPSGPEKLDPEYLGVVRDVIGDEKVLSMGGIRHHDDSALRHSLTVSLASYYIAKGLGFDAASTARGALLHDFFLYDWHVEKGRHHRTTHPRVALENARARFALNPIEEDIILTHMWPAASPFYNFKESFLVSTVDKIVSTKEVARMLLDKMP